MMNKMKMEDKERKESHQKHIESRKIQTGEVGDSAEFTSPDEELPQERFREEPRRFRGGGERGGRGRGRGGPRGGPRGGMMPMGMGPAGMAPGGAVPGQMMPQMGPGGMFGVPPGAAGGIPPFPGLEGFMPPPGVAFPGTNSRYAHKILEIFKTL